MSKFTPGPWHVAAYNDALYITSGRPPASSNDHPLNDSDRTVIAKMFIPDCGSRESNAALIADAPALLRALEKAVAHIERNTCLHEETYRGGAIWEICHQCGAKWADDEGGKPEFKWPEHVEQARALIARHRGGI